MDVLTDVPSTPMSFESPESSAMTGARYDPVTRQLTIDLRRPIKVNKDRTVTYVYEAFPAELWRQFVEAESKGRFFSEAIRAMFTGNLVEGETV